MAADGLSDDLIAARLNTPRRPSEGAKENAQHAAGAAGFLAIGDGLLLCVAWIGGRCQTRDIPVRPSADFAGPGSFFRMGREPVAVDILSEIPGVDFDAAWERRGSDAIDTSSDGCP